MKNARQSRVQTGVTFGTTLANCPDIAIALIYPKEKTFSSGLKSDNAWLQHLTQNVGLLHTPGNWNAALPSTPQLRFPYFRWDQCGQACHGRALMVDIRQRTKAVLPSGNKP